MISGEDTQNEKGYIQDAALKQHHAEERVLPRWAVKKECPFSKVTKDKGNEHNTPGLDDGLPPEMAHVSVQSLAACGTENHLREHEEPRESVLVQKPKSIVGIDRLTYTRSLDH